MLPPLTEEGSLFVFLSTYLAERVENFEFKPYSRQPKKNCTGPSNWSYVQSWHKLEYLLGPRNFALCNFFQATIQAAGFLRVPPKSSFKRLVLSTGLWQHTKMSTTLKSPNRLKDLECKARKRSWAIGHPSCTSLWWILQPPRKSPKFWKSSFQMIPSSTWPSTPVGTPRNTLHILLQSSASSSRRGWMQGARSSGRLLWSWPGRSRISWSLLSPRTMFCQTMACRPASWRSRRPRRCSKKPRSSTRRQLPRHMSNWGTSCLVIHSPNEIAFAARCMIVTHGLE